MGLSWMKKGTESAVLAKQEEAEHQKRKEEQGKMWRFFLKEGEQDAAITFVDGDLSEEGFLLPPRYYEHNLYLNGNWNNHFVCPEKTNPESGEKCPICEGGDRPSMVALFTVIDHRVFASSKDASKTHTNGAKLLVAKSVTFELLNKIAMKRGGLAGAKFDVSRIGDKAAAVGSMFDFTDKTPVEQCKQMYTKTIKDEKGVEKVVSVFEPADYENEIVFRTAAELRALGFGKPQAGAAANVTGKGLPAAKKPDPTNYEEQL